MTYAQLLAWYARVKPPFPPPEERFFLPVGTRVRFDGDREVAAMDGIVTRVGTDGWTAFVAPDGNEAWGAWCSLSSLERVE